MSFSPYEVLMGLAETDSPISDVADEEQVSTGASGSMILSSLDTGSVVSFNDTISLNSEILQDFGSMVSLPPGTLAALFRSQMESDDGEQTIVSSAPSGAFIPQPEASQDAWAISPHPSFVPGHAQSIPTVLTDTLSYQNLPEDATSNSSSDENSSPASHNAIVRAPLSRVSSMSSDGHDPVTFVAVANHLMRDSVNGDHWYTRFTEYDWEQFRVAAKMVLSILDPPPALLPLPPVPPAAHLPTGDDSCSYCAEDHLPSNFVCPLCKDVIVGALTLECGCASSTLCSSCWEIHTQGPHDMSDQLGYVWVDRKECPSCHGNANSNVPCHALDVAILHIVQSVSTGGDKTESLKRHYYSRLEEWRSTVLERNITRSQKETVHHDELLALLIQEEENVFWEQHRQKTLSNSTRNFLFLGQATVALIAATVASVGLSTLARR